MSKRQCARVEVRCTGDDGRQTVTVLDHGTDVPLHDSGQAAAVHGLKLVAVVVVAQLRCQSDARDAGRQHDLGPHLRRCRQQAPQCGQHQPASPHPHRPADPRHPFAPSPWLPPWLRSVACRLALPERLSAAGQKGASFATSRS